jgi:hypothetical protein
MIHPKTHPNSKMRSQPQVFTSISVEIVANTESKDKAPSEKYPSRSSIEADFSPKNFINPKYSERRKNHGKCCKNHIPELPNQ